jgi:hypothetical protein
MSADQAVTNFQAQLATAAEMAEDALADFEDSDLIRLLRRAGGS